jgi:hypothetical protein
MILFNFIACMCNAAVLGSLAEERRFDWFFWLNLGFGLLNTFIVVEHLLK